MESRNGGNVREILGVPALIVRRPQKNMYLSVRPDGMLRVSCPTGTPDAEIERFVAPQSRWLHKRRAAVLQMRDERTKHDAGDTVLLWGRSLPLVVTYGRPYGASLRGETILLNLPENGTADERGKLIHSFLRARLGLAIPPLLACARHDDALGQLQYAHRAAVLQSSPRRQRPVLPRVRRRARTQPSDRRQPFGRFLELRSPLSARLAAAARADQPDNERTVRRIAYTKMQGVTAIQNSNVTMHSSVDDATSMAA